MYGISILISGIDGITYHTESCHASHILSSITFAGVLDSGIGWPALMLSVSLELPIQLEDGGPEPLSAYFWGLPDEAVELRRLAWGLLVACSDDDDLIESAVDGGLLRYLQALHGLSSKFFNGICPCMKTAARDDISLNPFTTTPALERFGCATCHR